MTEHGKLRALSYLTLGLLCCLLNADQQSEARQVNKVTASGWTEVGKNWPISGSSGFFVATEKYHHFIEVKVPPNLAGDLKLKLRYFYNYAQVRPIFEIVPCNKRVDIFADSDEYLPQGRWLEHEITVNAKDCHRRPELAYHVLLHNKGDVFAWTSLEISTLMPEPKTTTTTTTTTTAATTTTGQQQTASATTLAPVEDWPSTTFGRELGDDIFFGPSTTYSVDLEQESRARTTESPTSTQTEAAATTTEASPVEPTTDYFSWNSPLTSTTQAPQSFVRVKEVTTAAPPEVPRDAEGNMNDFVEPTFTETTNDLADLDDRPKRVARSLASRLVFAETEDGKVDSIETRIRDRWTTTTTSTTQKPNPKPKPPREFRVSCTPRLCNRSQFKFARFATIINGLPTISSRDQVEGAKLLVSSAKPLKLELESADESFDELDACLNVTLFMDAGTSVNLTLRDANPNSQPRTMETVRRRAADSSASRWESFNRCVSDYLPAMQIQGPERHMMEFQLVPNELPAGKQIAIQFHANKSIQMRDPRPTLPFVPDVVSLASVERVDDFWLVDRDGYRKPTLRFEQLAPEVEGGQPQRRLIIENIDPTQQAFDLTSRWMRLRDAELYEEPIVMMYKVKNESWIESIDVEYQNASRPSLEWKTQNLYKKPTGASTSAVSTTAVSRPEDRVFPVRLFGLDSQPFRVRIRHKLSALAPQVVATAAAAVVATTTDPSQAAEPVELEHKTLNITSLAFADICAAGNYCLNKGRCVATGMLTAECHCRDGFSGRHCEYVDACNVIVEDALDPSGRKLPGREICAKVGARCVPNLPVLRCKWPNDRYYECRSLMGDDGLGDSGNGANSGNNPNGQGQKGNSQNGKGQIDDNQYGDYQKGDKQSVSYHSSNYQGGNQQSLTETLPGPRVDQVQMDPEQMVALKDKATNQAQLIIIMGVFMVAMLIFFIVILVNMITRLSKAKRRLQRSQSETRELARRNLPNTSTSVFAGSATNSTGRNKPPAVISYNNSAFDVE